MSSSLEAHTDLQLRCLGFPYVREYPFARDAIGNPKKGIRAALASAGLKDWRFDFAYKEFKIAVEVEGGIYTNGRHVRGKGFENDCEKYNNALVLGWRVLRFTSAHVKSGEGLILLDRLINDTLERMANTRTTS